MAKTYSHEELIYYVDSEGDLVEDTLWLYCRDYLAGNLELHVIEPTQDCEFFRGFVAKSGTNTNRLEYEKIRETWGGKTWEGLPEKEIYEEFIHYLINKEQKSAAPEYFDTFKEAEEYQAVRYIMVILPRLFSRHSSQRFNY